MAESSEKQPETEKSAFDIIKNWFLNSPSHGIRRISRAKSIYGQIFWTTTFLVFTTLMCVFISTIIKKYITNPTKISLSVTQYRDPEHFPAITFCNLNPLRRDKLKEINNYQPLLQCSTEMECYNRFNEYMDQFLNAHVNNTQPMVIKSGYTLDELLIRCTFNGRDCNRNFTSFFHPTYGNCFTFNNNNTVENSQRNDISYFWSIDDENVLDSYKLNLELYLYQNEYISLLDDRAAIRLFIHRKYEIPILSENSLFLPPKTFTKLIFSQRIISFSQQCRDELTDDMKQVFNSNSVRYSQALCYKLCEFRFIEKLCQCTDQLFMVFLQFFAQNQTTKINTTNRCSLNNPCQINRAHFNSRLYCPECLPECELIQYTIQSSYADYPNVRSTDKVINRIKEHLAKNEYSTNQLNTSACSNNRKEILLDDIVAVEISASPYATEILNESPMYTWVDLISSIGGQTGLWIGVSLISFVEIAELLLLLFFHFIHIIYQGILNQWKSIYRRYFDKTVSTKF